MFATLSSTFSRWATPLALTILLTNQPQVLAQRTPPLRNSPAFYAAFKNVVAKPSDSVVRVLAADQEVALGTIVSADGFIITKASELHDNIACKLKDGRTFTARLVGIEERHDLALLKIGASRLQAVEWRESKTAEIGHWVAAPGLGSDPVAVGVVSVAARKPSQFELDRSPRTLPRQNSGYMGVQLGVEDDGSPSIQVVTANSPAAKAGLKVGDIVVSVGGRLVRSREKLIATIQTLRPGQQVALKVKRDDEEKVINLKLAKYPLEQLGRSEKMNMMGSDLSHRLGHFPVFLQHDLLIKPHDCGGPIVDLDGKAVGINIARAGRTESYAIPAEAVQSLLPDLKSGKLAPVDDSEESRVVDLESTYNKLRTELVKLESREKDVTGDEAEALRKRVTELRKRLQKAKDELDQARKEPGKK